MKSLILAVGILALTCGCGSGKALTPVAFAAPTPSPTPLPTFPPLQPLVCSGVVQTGILCDESDGVHYYRHDQWTVATGPDGHGTFQVIEELGISQQTGLRQIQFNMPQSINIVEVHGTLTISSWCDNNGALSSWDSFATGSPIKSIVGAKTFAFNHGENAVYVIPQVIFPIPLQSNGLQLEAFTDLCATSTFHWIFNGSF